jgi:outer membrane protein assembly factor BamB
VLVDPVDGLFKMWYSGGTDTPDSIRRECGSPRSIGYAFSKDGIHWERPDLGLVEYNGSKHNNLLVLDAQAPSVFLTGDPVGSSTRFLMLLQGGQLTNETSVFASPDGIHWERDPRKPMQAGDWSGKTHEPFSVLHDPLESDATKRWKGYSLLHINEGGYRGRAVGYFYAADPHQWNEHPQQPIFSAFEGMESEIHIPHVTRFHDTYVMFYDAMEPNHHTQTEVAVSDNGEIFRRVHNGVKLLSNGPPGSVNAGKVCVSPRSLFTHAGKIWWYHTVSADTYQTSPRGLMGAPWYRYTNLAQWREDGLACLRASEHAGVASSCPMKLTSDALGSVWLNARTESGESIIVEIMSSRGDVIGRSKPWSGDLIRGDVQWAEVPKISKDERFTLQFSLKGSGAHIYALGVNGATREPIAPAPAAIPVTKHQWEFRAEGKISSSPVVADGKVFVTSWDQHLYALDAKDGRVVWSYKTANAIASSPAVDQGIVFVAGHDGIVHAVDAASGELKWKSPVHDGKKFNGFNPNGPWIDATPAIGVYAPKWNALVREPMTKQWGRKVETAAPRFLFVGAHDRHMHAFDPSTGNEAWRFPTFNWIISPVAVENYTVYFGSMDGFVYALDAQCGGLKWRYKAGRYLKYEPAVVPGSVVCEAVCGSPLLANGMLYIGGDDGFMYALDAHTGEERWVYQTRQWIWGRACIFGDHLVFASADGHVYGVNALTGKPTWKTQAGNANYADVISRHGQAVIACTDGWLYFINPNDGRISRKLNMGSPMRSAPTPLLENLLAVTTVDGHVRAIPSIG